LKPGESNTSADTAAHDLVTQAPYVRWRIGIEHRREQADVLDPNEGGREARRSQLFNAVA
jgi:hypothetical protein